MSSKSYKTKYLIIGAGLTGLSTAYFLKNNYMIVESSKVPGGTAGTLNLNGFKLDNAVHILYFKQKEIKNWILNQLEVSLKEKQRENSVWIKNRYVNFPLQYHLNQLPFYTRVLALSSIIKTLSLSKQKQKFNNFEEYSLEIFGQYITDVFVKPYNEKLFGTKLSEMNIDWMGDYVPRYSKTKMILGTLGFSNRNYGRNATYYYPLEGGISTLAQKISSQLKFQPMYNCEISKVLLSEKTATLNDGTLVEYDFLINSIPLNEFVNKIDYVPSTILESVKQLKKNPITLLHLMCKGNIKNNFDWVYVADPAIPFYRVTIPGNINPANCPPGHSSLTLEYGGDVYSETATFDNTLEALRKMDLLNSGNTVIDHHWKLINCGYVIYDKMREDTLNNIFKYLHNNNIRSVGRYGSWEYSNMEDAILHGKNVAEKLLIKN